MLPEKKTKTNIGIGVSIVIDIVAHFVPHTGRVAATLGLILLLIGLGFFIWGCMNYAEGKGHPKWFGFLGLGSFIGLFILVLLPDRTKKVNDTVAQSTPAPTAGNGNSDLTAFLFPNALALRRSLF
jgi:hypothetical protein